MKKIIFAATILFLTASAFTMIGEPEKDLLGKWRIDDAYINTFVTAQIESRRKVNPEQAEQMEQNMEMMVQTVGSLVFEYKADNTIDLTTPQGVQNVKYRLVNSNRNLIIIRPDGTERKDSILELSPVKFKVLQGERKDTIVYIRP